MAEIFHRYPGAQPFRDDEFSRRTFFGRDQASIALTDQILANRLVIVFAKSGLGKTSLLNASVAPRLREPGSLPLFVRVNDIKHGPFASVLDGVRLEASRQEVEYIEGDSSSLWSFFKTAEFWRGDLLLKPVLILDQFEELFTLQSQEARERFLSELGYLVRGIAPPSQSSSQSLGVSDKPPSVRVVLSLREDFLGLLEEASDHIPQILDHRYRLAPLTYKMASKAITGPAAIEDPQIATRAFALEPEFVAAILDYLAKSHTQTVNTDGRQVEPFHLQLICQRIEKIAALKQKVSSDPVVLSFKEFGGEAALADTLGSFYTDAIRSLPGRRVRGAVRILCEQYLISPEGRRLSVEERELCRQLKLPKETLRHLVERRLLRTDRRSDSTYYELSHDALIRPVLASRRMQALVVGWTGVVAGTLAYVVAGTIILFLIVGVSRESDRNSGTLMAVLFLGTIAVFLWFKGSAWFRSGNLRRRRYSNRAPVNFDEPTRVLLPLRDRLLGWSMLVTGPMLFATWGFVGIFGLVMFGIGFLTGGDVPTWPSSISDVVHRKWKLLQYHPVLETEWVLAEYSAIVILGWLLFRQGNRKLWPHRYSRRSRVSVPGIDHPPSIPLASLKLLFGALGLMLAALGSIELKSCASAWNGSIPHWLNWAMITYRLSSACQVIYQTGWDFNGLSFALCFFSTFILSVVSIRKGIVEIVAALHHRRIAQPEKTSRRLLVWSAVCGIPVAAVIFFWIHSGSPRPQPSGDKEQRTRATYFDSEADAGKVGWAVGDQASILHTDDGGITWKKQNKGSGWFYSVTFPTQQLGWAVGAGGSIWHTDDGGSTWKTQSSNVKTNLSTVASWGPRSAWTVGREGTILHTVDGGATWKRQVSGTQKNLIALAFITSQTGWVAGTDGTILQTQDGGDTWKQQKSGTSHTLNYIAFATPQSGWAAGGDGTILHTEDGGHLWQKQASGTIWDLDGISFVTPQSGWVVGEKGTILHTQNGGRTWKLQPSGIRMDVFQVAFVTPLSGWGVGEDGVILHTRNGGETWFPQQSGSRADLKSVSFVRPYGVIRVEFKAAPAAGSDHAHGVSRGGVTIQHVIAGGPADEAGLIDNDVLLAVSGKQVNVTGEAVAAIAVLTPGTSAHLTYLRNGKNRTADVTIGDGSKSFSSPPKR